MTVAGDSGGSEQTYCYHQDGLGSVRNLTDADGVVVNTYDYLPFGEPYALLTSVAVEQRYTYTGRESTVDPTLMYYRWRSYYPSRGLFLSRDVFRYGSLNLYEYVHNNPGIYSDSYGLYPSLASVYKKIGKAAEESFENFAYHFAVGMRTLHKKLYQSCIDAPDGSNFTLSVPLGAGTIAGRGKKEEMEGDRCCFTMGLSGTVVDFADVNLETGGKIGIRAGSFGEFSGGFVVFAGVSFDLLSLLKDAIAGDDGSVTGHGRGGKNPDRDTNNFALSAAVGLSTMGVYNLYNAGGNGPTTEIPPGYVKVSMVPELSFNLEVLGLSVEIDEFRDVAEGIDRWVPLGPDMRRALLEFSNGVEDSFRYYGANRIYGPYESLKLFTPFPE